MVVISFENPVPSAYEDAAIGVIWYTSIDGLVFTEVTRNLLTELSLDLVTGEYSWSVIAADPTWFHLIKTYSVSGAQSFTGSLLPPVPPNPTLQHLFGYAKELGTAWAVGDTVTVVPASGQIVNGAILDPTPKIVTISANGIFSVLIDKGAKVKVFIGSYYSKAITISPDDTRNIASY